MKTKLKSVSRKISVGRIVAKISPQPIIPLRERRLNFGDKWNYASAPEDSKNYVIAPRYELLQTGGATSLKRYSNHVAVDGFSAKVEDPYRILDTVEFQTAWPPIGV